MKKIEVFTLHNDRGQSVLSCNLLNWIDDLKHPSGIFGPVVKYTWRVDNLDYEAVKTSYWCLLPDATGFIAFESDHKPDNCLLLDVYGKQRMRLTVPWRMTGSVDEAAGKSPTSFDNVSEPYINPQTGAKGTFGVTAYIADVFGCKFYFELDYQTGQFLWFKRIRD